MTEPSHRLTRLSSAAVAVIGLAYVAVIATWLVVVRTPAEPIGDPYLWWMEVLTIFSAAALGGLAVALWSATRETRPLHAMGLLAAGLAGAATTLGVHFVQLTAVRQLWRAGAIEDYRLVWPSVLFAVEYLAWDGFVGLFMLFAAGAMAAAEGALTHWPGTRLVRRLWTLGGALCLAGLVGPATGAMAWQNLAVAGYAVLLPVGAAALAITSTPSASAASRSGPSNVARGIP